MLYSEAPEPRSRGIGQGRQSRRDRHVQPDSRAGVQAGSACGPDQARQLLGLLVAQIFNPKHGGPAGFVQVVQRTSGLGELVDSWLGQGPNQPITPAQLESVIGSDTLAGFAIAPGTAGRHRGQRGGGDAAGRRSTN